MCFPIIVETQSRENFEEIFIIWEFQISQSITRQTFKQVYVLSLGILKLFNQFFISLPGKFYQSFLNIAVIVNFLFDILNLPEISFLSI